LVIIWLKSWSARPLMDLPLEPLSVGGVGTGDWLGGGDWSMGQGPSQFDGGDCSIGQGPSQNVSD